MQVATLLLRAGVLNVFERIRIEVVVGKQNHPEARSVQVLEFLNDRVVVTYPRYLAVLHPYRTERALFGAPANRLYGSHQVGIQVHKVPTRRCEEFRVDAATLVVFLQTPGCIVIEKLRPHQLGITGHGSITVLERFLGENRSVWPAENDRRPSLLQLRRHLVGVDYVCRVDAKPNEVSLLYVTKRKFLNRLID